MDQELKNQYPLTSGREGCQIGFFRDTWRQKSCLAFSFRYLAFFEAVDTYHQLVVWLFKCLAEKSYSASLDNAWCIFSKISGNPSKNKVLAYLSGNQRCADSVFLLRIRSCVVNFESASSPTPSLP